MYAKVHFTILQESLYHSHLDALNISQALIQLAGRFKKRKRKDDCKKGTFRIQVNIINSQWRSIMIMGKTRSAVDSNQL